MSYTYTIISLNHRNANQKLENIPEHTTELLLSSLHLGGRFTEEQLTQFFEKLSENLVNLGSLNLSNNHLDQISSHDKTKAQKLFESLPRHLQSLDLSTNALGNKPADILEEIFKNLPANLEILNLSNNSLFRNKSIDELVKILQNLHPHLQSLNLSDNYLFTDKSVNEIQRILVNLPPDLKSLNLNQTFLFKDKSLPEALEILQSLPQTLFFIDLSDNNIEIKSQAELAQIVEQLPRSLQSLKLSYDIKTRQNLAQICLALPRNIQSICIGEYELNKQELALLKLEAELFDCLDDEITRLESSNKKNKIITLNEIKQLFSTELFDKENGTAALEHNWIEWKKRQENFSNQRNIYSLFNSPIENKIISLMEGIIEIQKKDPDDFIYRSVKSASNTVNPTM